MKIRILALLSLIAIVGCQPIIAADTPPPAATPAPQVVVVQAAPAPQSASDRVQGWIALATLVIGGIGTLAVYALKKVAEVLPVLAELRAVVSDMRGRQDRQAAKVGQVAGIQAQQLAASPPIAITTQPPTQP